MLDLHRRALAGDHRPVVPTIVLGQVWRIARKLGIPIGSIGPTWARTLAELRSVLEQRAGGAVTTVLPARATIR